MPCLDTRSLLPSSALEIKLFCLQFKDTSQDAGAAVLWDIGLRTSRISFHFIRATLAGGMTILDLCSAAMMYSDNTATNLIVKKLGGPEAVTAFARSIMDNTFRVDSWEPELNSDPSDLRDTSTPTAMEKSLQKLTLGNVLASPQRKQLVTWMKGNTTGDARIRAGVPKGWIVADKTGAGDDYGISNDIGIIWPPSCAPIVVAIYSVHNKKDTTRSDDAVASAARLVINEFAQTDKCIKRK